MRKFTFTSILAVIFAGLNVFGAEFVLKDNATGTTYGPFEDANGTEVTIGKQRLTLSRKPDGDLTKARFVGFTGADLYVNDASVLDEWAAGLIKESGLLKGCEHWIYFHPNRKYDAKLTYVFDRPVTSFAARIAIGRPEGDGNAVFVVLADGKEVYRSDAISGGMPPVRVQVQFPPAKKIQLVGERNGSYAHDLCMWLEPQVK